MAKKVSKKEALAYHAEVRPGKIEVIPTKKHSSQRELSLAYSPGVAEPCIQIDKKKDEWQQAIDQENLEWINISSLKGWDSESTDVYYVSYTPTFYLVDNQTTIVGRPDGKEDVIRMLNNLLR